MLSAEVDVKSITGMSCTVGHRKGVSVHFAKNAHCVSRLLPICHLAATTHLMVERSLSYLYQATLRFTPIGFTVIFSRDDPHSSLGGGSDPVLSQGKIRSTLPTPGMDIQVLMEVVAPEGFTFFDKCM